MESGVTLKAFRDTSTGFTTEFSQFIVSFVFNHQQDEDVCLPPAGE